MAKVHQWVGRADYEPEGRTCKRCNVHVHAVTKHGAGKRGGDLYEVTYTYPDGHTVVTNGNVTPWCEATWDHAAGKWVTP